MTIRQNSARGGPKLDTDLTNLYAVLDDELDLMSEHDIETADIDDINRILSRYGFDGDMSIDPRKCATKALKADQARDEELSADGHRPSHADEFDMTSESANLAGHWLAPRNWLAERVVNALHENDCVVVEGARGSGKSTFLRQLLPRNDKFRATAAKRVIIDCFALTMPSRRLLEMEALYAQFGNDEDGYKAFLTRLREEPTANNCSCADPLDCPLESFLIAKFARFGGVVIFDHIDRLSTADEILTWIYALIKRLNDLGVKVIIATSGEERVRDAAPVMAVEAEACDRVASQRRRNR